MQQDRAQCLEAFLQKESYTATEGMRDKLYLASVFLQQNQNQQRKQQAVEQLEHIPLEPCRYSGVPAVQILVQHKSELSIAAVQRLQDFLQVNLNGWEKELERSRWDSYYLLAATSLAGYGCLFDCKKWVTMGYNAVEKMLHHCRNYDLPNEYLSPFYTALQLSSLAVMQLLPASEHQQKVALQLEQFIWDGVLRHFVPGFLQLVGPYSRAYSTELCGQFQADMAVLYRVLGQDTGYTLRDTLWNADYTKHLLTHGTLENMQLYALYFSGIEYHCDTTAVEGWKQRCLPVHQVETVHINASNDDSITKFDEDKPKASLSYPESVAEIHSILDESCCVAWTNREFENGMACNSLCVLYQKEGQTKTCFTKLARNHHFMGQWNEYPNLGLRLSACNFPDDGRKTVQQTDNGLLVRYTPRSACSQDDALRLCILFPVQFSSVDQVCLNGTKIDLGEDIHSGVSLITVQDGEYSFYFEPLTKQGHWRVFEKNEFLNIEWTKSDCKPENTEWTFLFRWKKHPQKP